MTTIPVKKDTVPRAIRDMAIDWLADNDLPAEWEDAVAQEFDAAIADRKLEIVRTHEKGRPYNVSIVDWQAGLNEHGVNEDYEAMRADLIPIDDAKEVAQDGHRYG